MKRQAKRDWFEVLDCQELLLLACTGRVEDHRAERSRKLRRIRLPIRFGIYFHFFAEAEDYHDLAKAAPWLFRPYRNVPVSGEGVVICSSEREMMRIYHGTKGDDPNRVNRYKGKIHVFMLTCRHRYAWPRSLAPRSFPHGGFENENT